MHSCFGCICLAFFPLCIIKCFLKLFAQGVTLASLVWLFHCAFSNDSSNCLPKRKHSRIGCICLTFLHCAFSNVSLNLLLQMMHSYICCICSAFFHHVFSNVSSNHLQEKKHIHIGYICLISIVSRCGHLLAKYSKQHLEPIEGHEGRVDWNCSLER